MKRKVFLLGAAVLLLGYVFLTPIGALRTAVALAGYPVSACTMQVREATAKDVGLIELDNPKHSTIYRIETNIPHELDTDADLENWIVCRKFGIYMGEYYGWC